MQQIKCNTHKQQVEQTSSVCRNRSKQSAVSSQLYTGAGQGCAAAVCLVRSKKERRNSFCCSCLKTLPRSRLSSGGLANGSVSGCRCGCGCGCGFVSVAGFLGNGCGLAAMTQISKSFCSLLLVLPAVCMQSSSSAVVVLRQVLELKLMPNQNLKIMSYGCKRSNILSPSLLAKLSVVRSVLVTLSVSLALSVSLSRNIRSRALAATSALANGNMLELPATCCNCVAPNLDKT